MDKKLLITATLTVLACLTLDARTINIHGKVTMLGTNEPLFGVTIYNGKTDKLIGVTADDGRFAVTADSEDELIFSSLTCAELTEPISGRQEINVILTPEAKELEEITVVAKSKGNTLIVEPSDIEVSGNYLLLRTFVGIPHKSFNSSTRMIIQPAVYHVTRRHLTYIKPVVYDGFRYAITQDRMYDRDKTRDPLTPYQQIKHTSKRTKDKVRLVDSLYVENPNDDYMWVVMTALEDYNRIVYTDTFTIGRGTVNPMRFLKYSLDPLRMDEEKFLPLPEVELRDADGQVNLLFPVGKTELQLDLGNNAAELDGMIAQIREIENDPDMSLKSFAISGSASPEGRYESNLRLAKGRMNSAMERVLESIDPSVRRNAEISSHAEVATWEEAIEMLRADGKNEEADQMQSVLDRYSGADARSMAMTRLPFYRSLLVADYLPRMRRVNYHIVSSRYRPLTDAEIADLYRTKPKSLSRYQYYRLYNSQPDSAREEIIRNALIAHPKFTVAATDLSEIILKRNENPMDMLMPFFEEPGKWKNLPTSMRYNMGVACINAGRFSLADSILSELPDDKKFHKGQIYSQALNGHYQEVMQEISEDSPLNEVILLLTMKDNDRAWRKAKKLGNSAVEEYIKAVAANRVDDYLAAISHLENAFSLDPSLREIAKIDGDIIDLLEEEDLNDPNDDPENE